MKKIKLIGPQVLATLSGTILSFAAGFHIGWASPSLPKLLEDTSFPINSKEVPCIVSTLAFGGAIGGPCSFLMVDRWGRKTLLLLLSIPCLASGVLITFARNCWWYYVARFVIGASGSVAFVVILMYIGEIAEDKIRGGLGLLVIVMYNSGLVLVYSVGPWVSLLSLATIAIPVVSLATFVWIPESPYFYIMKNRPELARKSLQWLRGTTHVDEEIEVVKKNVEFDLQNAGTFKELLIDPGNGKGLLIVLFTCQQLSGVLAVLSYSTIILNETGSGATSSISVIVIGLIQFVASFSPLFMADRIGRRPLLLGSMFFSIIFLISMYVLAVSP